MIIRPATESDKAAIATVHAASWREAYRDILPAAYLGNDVGNDLATQWHDRVVTKDDVVLVLEDPDIVGFIAVWCEPDPFIDNLHVLPERRSGGLGRQLMAHAASELIERDHASAHLWVLKDNRRARAFYGRIGGQEAETKTKPIFGHDLPHVKIVWTDLTSINAS
ncbi:MAG: N-acetyltransferase [Pseudomonadota bacterium]